jgi:phosphate-selective porin OprO and OprP
MKKIILLTSLFLSFGEISEAQVVYHADEEQHKFSGLGLYNNDSTFSMNLRFRMQARMGYTVDDNFKLASSEYFLRRLRVRMSGFMWSKKLNYDIQLSFSRGDMDWDNTGFPNIIRDAVVSYKASKDLTLVFGQTKLPGNRERVISSSELQFPDRSTANARFNIDRDFGVQVVYEPKIGKQALLVFKGALSSGKGRNNPSIAATRSDGFAYTGRMEILPMGEFAMKGDYTEGDWIRETKPKLSIGATYHLNEKALRTGGILGTLLQQPRDMEQVFVDAIFKHQGWALMTEYMNRKTKNDSPVTVSADGKTKTTFYDGFGVNTQLSYQFKNHWEVAGRYTLAEPTGETRLTEPQQKDYSIGITRYLNYHRLKLQLEATKTDRWDLIKTQSLTPNYTFRFQIEAGI